MITTKKKLDKNKQKNQYNFKRKGKMTQKYTMYQHNFSQKNSIFIHDD